MKAPCSSRVFVMPGNRGKRVDIAWDADARKWVSVPIPVGAIAIYCDGDRGHDGTCCGDRSEAEYQHLLRQSRAAKDPA